MKIGIINQTGSTGSWNYMYSLVQALKKNYPDLDITIFLDCVYQDYFNVMINKLTDIGIKTEQLIPFDKNDSNKFVIKNKTKNKFLNKIINKVRRLLFNLKKNRNKKNYLDFDLIFYTWPYEITPLGVDIPMFFIAHDFILSHFFGSYMGNNVYSNLVWNEIRPQLESFYEKGIPIVSSPFIKEEAKRIFPQYADKVNVVFLTKLNDFTELSDEQITTVLKKFDINNDYILYANNAQLHKNLGQVVSAYYYIKQKYPNIKLIITGFLTDNATCIVNNPYYADFVNDTEEYDIKALGEVPSEDFSALLQGAKMVINASLCEAGSGSGVDAWSMNTPLVMSDIPPFKQQIEFLGTKAELFDPRNSKDIARAVLKLLDNPELARENARISKENIDKYTWDDVAKQYFEIFKNGVKK